MLQTPLTKSQREFLAQERAVLEGLQLALARLDAAPEDQRRLRQSLRQLEDFFLLVVVGEFNSGKSAFINTLLGAKLLPEGVTPTTSRINIVRYGEQPSQETREEDVLLLSFPVEWLRAINVVDTPGTNAVIQRHQEITEDFVPRCDLVLFITSADRPFTESERAFLERIRAWGKKVVVVINKLDLLEEEADVEKVRLFVQGHAEAQLGVRPEIFFVSARLAQKAKAAGGAEGADLWTASHFGPLEDYLLRTLDDRQRVRLKLESPLGVAARLQETYAAATEARLRLLAEDLRTIDAVEAQLRGHEEELRRDFKYQLSHVDNVLHEMSARGMEFFDEKIRLGRVFDLLNTSRVRAEFEEKVTGDTVPRIEAQVGELIDWLVERDYRQWQGVMEHLNRRAEQHRERIVGQVGGRFEFNRRELLDSVGRAAREVVSGYDRAAEARQLAHSVQRAVAQTAIAQVGALGLGAVLLGVLHTTLADLTGLLAAGTVAAMGLYILPARRARAKQELRGKLETLRGRLAEALTSQFERELGRSLQRIREAVAPYTRFIQSERGTLGEIATALQSSGEGIRALRAGIPNL